MKEYPLTMLRLRFNTPLNITQHILFTMRMRSNIFFSRTISYYEDEINEVKLYQILTRLTNLFFCCYVCFL